MSYDQIHCEDVFRDQISITHSIGNIFKQVSYFEQTGAIHFETIPDNSGLGAAIVAFIRFSSGNLALIGTRPTTMHQGVELLCSGLESEDDVLNDFRQAFPEIGDDDIDRPKNRDAEHGADGKAAPAIA